VTSAAVSPPVVVYRTRYCPYCGMATRLLSDFQIPFREVDVSGDRERRRWLAAVTGQSSVPQIFVGEQPIGGYAELRALLRRGPEVLLRSAAAAAPETQLASAADEPQNKR
jgi:glutaredoxin 3